MLLHADDDNNSSQQQSSIFPTLIHQQQHLSHNHNSSSTSRIRSVSNSNLQHHKASQRLSPSAIRSGGIRKKAVAPSRHRTVSTSYADHWQQLALNQSIEVDLTAEYQHQQQQQADHHYHITPAVVAAAAADLDWLTPQHSPEPSCLFQPASVQLDHFQWTAPTPPHSDSGIPTLPADVGDKGVITTSGPGISSPKSYTFDHITAAPDMSSLSSLGFLLPQQYSSGSYPSGSNNPSYDSEHSARTQPPSTTTSQYGQTVLSSPSLYQSRPARRMSDLPAPSQMYSAPPPRRIAHPYESPAQSDYSMPQSQAPLVSPMSSPMPVASSSVAPGYNAMRSPAMYDSQFYSSPYSSAPGGSQMYTSASGYTPSLYTESSSSGVDPAGRSESSRGMNQKPKPQCFEHGCNGRQFSTFSNLLRHQREKSGMATKSFCPRCGAEFTRTTARNGHLLHDKCAKVRRLSEDQSS